MEPSNMTTEQTIGRQIAEHIVFGVTFGNFRNFHTRWTDLSSPLESDVDVTQEDVFNKVSWKAGDGTPDRTDVARHHISDLDISHDSHAWDRAARFKGPGPVS